MTFEEEFRAKAARTQLKLAALDMLSKLSSNLPRGHSDSCNYLDDTGYPAPCSCGYHDNNDVKALAFIRQAVLEAN